MRNFFETYRELRQLAARQQLSSKLTQILDTYGQVPPRVAMGALRVEFDAWTDYHALLDSVHNRACATPPEAMIFRWEDLAQGFHRLESVLQQNNLRGQYPWFEAALELLTGRPGRDVVDSTEATP